MTARPAVPLPNWPAMMGRAMAAAYCDMSVDSFDVVAAFYGCRPLRMPVRLLRWRKADLDALIDRLPQRGQVDDAPAGEVVDMAQAALKAVAGQMRR